MRSKKKTLIQPRNERERRAGLTGAGRSNPSLAGTKLYLSDANGGDREKYHVEDDSSI